MAEETLDALLHYVNYVTYSHWELAEAAPCWRNSDQPKFPGAPFIKIAVDPKRIFEPERAGILQAAGTRPQFFQQWRTRSTLYHHSGIPAYPLFAYETKTEDRPPIYLDREHDRYYAYLSVGELRPHLPEDLIASLGAIQKQAFKDFRDFTHIPTRGAEYLPRHDFGDGKPRHAWAFPLADEESARQFLGFYRWSGIYHEPSHMTVEGNRLILSTGALTMTKTMLSNRREGYGENFTGFINHLNDKTVVPHAERFRDEYEQSIEDLPPDMDDAFGNLFSKAEFGFLVHRKGWRFVLPSKQMATFSPGYFAVPASVTGMDELQAYFGDELAHIPLEFITSGRHTVIAADAFPMMAYGMGKLMRDITGHYFEPYITDGRCRMCVPAATMEEAEAIREEVSDIFALWNSGRLDTIADPRPRVTLTAEETPSGPAMVFDCPEMVYLTLEHAKELLHKTTLRSLNLMTGTFAYPTKDISLINVFPLEDAPVCFSLRSDFHEREWRIELAEASLEQRLAIRDALAAFEETTGVSLHAHIPLTGNDPVTVDYRAAMRASRQLAGYVTLMRGSGHAPDRGEWRDRGDAPSAGREL